MAIRPKTTNQPSIRINFWPFHTDEWSIASGTIVVPCIFTIPPWESSHYFTCVENHLKYVVHSLNATFKHVSVCKINMFGKTLHISISLGFYLYRQTENVAVSLGEKGGNEGHGGFTRFKLAYFVFFFFGPEWQWNGLLYPSVNKSCGATLSVFIRFP